jgi:hypothetical protein
MRRLILLVILGFAPLVIFAQQPSPYKTVSLDEVFVQWNEITKGYAPGMSVMQPQKIRFVAKYVSLPQPCSNRALETIFNTLAKPDVLKQINVNHCIKLESASGNVVIAWTQDVLVPGLNEDIKPNTDIEIYADLLAYGVGTDRSRNMPFMMVNRFEPK